MKEENHGLTSAMDNGGRRLGLLSVVAPIFNEEETVNEFCARTRTVLADLPYELVMVDDGSRDRTPEILDRLAAEDPRVRVVHLSRNFGHQTALTAGLDHAQGDAVVMIDADLQDPPELIPAMLDYWRRGSDVVYGVRRERTGETRFKLATARWFYRLMAKLSPIEIPADAGDFRLLDRQALDALLSMRERNRFLRGMTVWVGYTQTALPYERDRRLAGDTKYTLRKMLRFSLDAISSFSHVPLQAATMLGFALSAVALVALPLVVVARYTGIYVRGVPSLMFVVLLLGGIQLITIGLIGEYVGRIYDEVKRRPLYLVRATRNIDAQAGEVDELRHQTIARP
jgi:polyisoprenyl-phosphate glycosyltransferase